MSTLFSLDFVLFGSTIFDISLFSTIVLSSPQRRAKFTLRALLITSHSLYHLDQRHETTNYEAWYITGLKTSHGSVKFNQMNLR